MVCSIVSHLVKHEALLLVWDYFQAVAFSCMTLGPVLHAQAKKKKKEEAANAKLLEAEKRIKVSLEKHQSFYFPTI